AAVDLLHRPQAPLPRLGLAFERARIKPAMLLGEIERDCERLPQDEAAVVDRRQTAVGVDREPHRSRAEYARNRDRAPWRSRARERRGCGQFRKCARWTSRTSIDFAA